MKSSADWNGGEGYAMKDLQSLSAEISTEPRLNPSTQKSSQLCVEGMTGRKEKEKGSC